MCAPGNRRETRFRPLLLYMESREVDRVALELGVCSSTSGCRSHSVWLGELCLTFEGVGGPIGCSSWGSRSGLRSRWTARGWASGG